MAEKDSTSNWWKKVVERRKGQEGPQDPPPVEKPMEGASAGVPFGETIPPSSETPPVSPPLEEQIDQVISPGEPGPAPPPPKEPIAEAPAQPSAAPPKPRRSQQIWPPPRAERAAMEPGVEPQPPKPTPPPQAMEAPAPEPGLPRRSGRLPNDFLACLILVDIAGEMRHVRKIPHFFPLQRLNTLTGRHAKAHIHLDDEATILPEHARIICQDHDGRWEFSLHPQSGGEVTVEGKPVPQEGVVLKNGDLISIGSAKLVFFMKDLRDRYS